MKKILTAVLGLLLFVGAYAGDGSLDRVKKEGKVVIGLDDAFPPMGFRGDKGEIVGFDIDLANEVFKRLGVKPEFRPCDWDGIILSLKSKKIDLIWSGMSITPEREKQISFTKPYLTGDGPIIVSRADNQIELPDNLTGKVVGTQMGGTPYFTLQKITTIKPKEVKLYQDFVQAFMDLKAKRIDAVVVDDLTGKYLANKDYNKNSKNPLVVGKTSISKQNDGMGVGFRKEDNDLRIAIDTEIEKMKKDGTYDAIYKKWLGDK